MARSRRQLVWALTVGLAVAAQLSPPALCRACDRPCCVSEAGDHCPKPSDSGVGSAAGCPLCSHAADLRPAEANERPCDCLLQARHDQPRFPTRGSPPHGADGGPAIGPAVVVPGVPPVLGASREYVAALLAMPIRPPRILFGVWRN